MGRQHRLPFRFRDGRGEIAMTAPVSPSTTIALRVFLPFAFGYFLSYVFRTVNSVIAPNLVADVGLNAAALGLLTSTFYLAFALFQLPLGLLLDRYGPRRVEVALLLVAAAGAALFALGQSLAMLTVGRAMIGLGVSCCMMAAFKAFVQWFPSNRLAAINGSLMGFGGLGALAATVPVEWALGPLSWRTLFLIIAGASVLVAVAVHRVVPEHADAPEDMRLRDQLRGLRQVFRDRLFWRIAPLCAVAQGSFLAMQGLWVGPWLRDVAGQDRATIALHLAALSIAIVAGLFLFGTLAARLARHGVRAFTVMGLGLAVFTLINAALAAGLTLPPLLLWAMFGFFGTAGTLAYAALSQAFPRHLAGRSNTGLNLIVFLTAFALQWGMGAVIHRWENPVTHLYDPAGYQAVFAIVTALLVAALLWFFIGAWREPHAAHAK